MAESCFVYMTAGSRAEAEAIGRALIEERLAACVNLIDNMTSLYWWEGGVEQGNETVLIAKTARARLDALTERVKALHSYSCPCVVALAVADGNPDFLAWITTETAGGR